MYKILKYCNILYDNGHSKFLYITPIKLIIYTLKHINKISEIYYIT